MKSAKLEIVEFAETSELKIFTKEWSKIYSSEVLVLKSVFKDNLILYHHIGSTSIAQLPSKPIIDIIIARNNYCQQDRSWNQELDKKLNQFNYHYTDNIKQFEDKIQCRNYYRFDSDNDNNHAYLVYLSIIDCNDPYIAKLVKFRDFLNENKQWRQRYAKLKLELVTKDQFLYSKGKQQFFQEICKRIEFHSPEKVKILAQDRIMSSKQSSVSELESPFMLGPFDQLVLPSIPIQVVFIYKDSLNVSVESSSEADLKISQFNIIPLEKLKQSLTLLLDYYPHLTGRIQLNKSDNSIEIGRLGEGIKLFSATCNIPLYSYTDDTNNSTSVLITDLPAGGNALLPPLDSSIDSVYNDPIFSVQHTRFSCGSVSLGIRVLHTVCDASGFFQLVSDLAEIYRNLLSGNSTVLSHLPHIQCFQKNFHLTCPQEQRRDLLKFQPLYYQLTNKESCNDIIKSETHPNQIASRCIGRVLRFSALELSAIKRLAANSENKSNSNNKWISTFDALSAHLYQRIHCARHILCEDHKTGESSSLSSDFLAPVNWRPVDRLNLPHNYFANSLFTPFFAIPSEILKSSPLSTVANILHDEVRKMKPGEAIKTLQWIAVQPDKKKIELKGFRFNNGGLMISSWSKFDLYKATTFDVSPSMVAPPFTVISLLDGLGYMLPTPCTTELIQNQSANNDTLVAIDLYLSVNEDLWEILDGDEKFRQFQPSNS